MGHGVVLHVNIFVVKCVVAVVFALQCAMRTALMMHADHGCLGMQYVCWKDHNTFIVVIQEVEQFAKDMLALGQSPSQVDGAISRHRAEGRFSRCADNERGRPLLRELQLWKFEQQTKLWLSDNSWADFVLALKELQQHSDMFVDVENLDPANNDPAKRNFKCFIQHPQQAKWLDEYAEDVLFLDSTHGTNNYGMQLFIGATQVPGGLALPLFFFMCTVEKGEEYQMQNGLEWMFERVYSKHPNFNPAAVIMDHDVSEHNALAAFLIRKTTTALERLQQDVSKKVARGEVINVPIISRQEWPGCTSTDLDGTTAVPSSSGNDQIMSYLQCVHLLECWRSARQTIDTELQQLVQAQLPKHIPEPPSDHCYTELLMEDISKFLQHLQYFVKTISQHQQQAVVWSQYRELAVLFASRHSRSGGGVSSFCQQNLRTVKLLCEFHTKKSWNEKINAHVKDKEEARQIYGEMVSIMKDDLSFSHTFLCRITSFTNKWEVKYGALVDYFANNYFCREWRDAWARAGRMFKHGNQDTTLPLERINGTLMKYVQMKGIVNIRPATLIGHLVGNPASPASMHDNLVAFYQRRLQDYQCPKYARRPRRHELETKALFQALCGEYDDDKSVCKLVDEVYGIWQVVDGINSYTCCPKACSCDCPARRDVCAHLMLVESVQAVPTHMQDEMQLVDMGAPLGVPPSVDDEVSVQFAACQRMFVGPQAAMLPNDAKAAIVALLAPILPEVQSIMDSAASPPIDPEALSSRRYIDHAQRRGWRDQRSQAGKVSTSDVAGTSLPPLHQPARTSSAYTVCLNQVLKRTGVNCCEDGNDLPMYFC